MGVEDLGFEKVQGPVGTVTEGENSAKENGKLEEGSGHNEPIKFGSHGDEMAKKEGNGVAVQNFPQDAVDEWPAPKQIHSFYSVRYRTYDDPKLKAKIEQANVEVQKKNQASSRVLEALNAKRVSGEKQAVFFRNFITIVMFGAIGALVSCTIIVFGTSHNYPARKGFHDVK